MNHMIPDQLLGSTEPQVLLKHTTKHAVIRYLEFNEGADICVSAHVSEPCIISNYTQKGSLQCDLLNFGKVTLKEDKYHLFCVSNGELQS
jgi:hypothetical protein